MFKSSNNNFVGKQSCFPIERLQCSLYVCDGLCDDDLSFRIYVSRDTTTTNLYELCRTGIPTPTHKNFSIYSFVAFTSTNTLCYRTSSKFFDVQKEF